MSLHFRPFATAFVLALAGSLAQAQQSLDNAAVIKLTQSGLSEDLIITTINASAGHYDTGTDALIALKKANVTDKEIGAMFAKNANPNGAAPAAPVAATASALPPGVDEIGVYYKDTTGAWTQFNPEIVNYKTGGVLKSLATNGIVKGDVNGHLAGPSAKLTLTRPITFLIYAPEGTAPSEYQLLKLHVSGNGREFRTVTGGVFHTSTGATKDSVAFTSTKIAPRIYQVTLGPETVIGEYGVLPPGANSSSSAASAGKIYTFHILE
jgi:hypothetical protein